MRKRVLENSGEVLSLPHLCAACTTLHLLPPLLTTPATTACTSRYLNKVSLGIYQCRQSRTARAKAYYQKAVCPFPKHHKSCVNNICVEITFSYLEIILTQNVFEQRLGKHDFNVETGGYFASTHCSIDSFWSNSYLEGKRRSWG